MKHALHGFGRAIRSVLPFCFRNPGQVPGKRLLQILHRKPFEFVPLKHFLIDWRAAPVHPDRVCQIPYPVDFQARRCLFEPYKLHFPSIARSSRTKLINNPQRMVILAGENAELDCGRAGTIFAMLPIPLVLTGIVLLNGN